MTVEEIRIIFDGPPGPKGGRFVEVEDTQGYSIRAGQWRKRPDELWELQIILPRHPHRSGEDDACAICGHDLRHAVHLSGRLP